MDGKNAIRLIHSLLNFEFLNPLSHIKFNFVGAVNTAMPFQSLELILLSGMAERILSWGAYKRAPEALTCRESEDIRLMGF